MKKADVKPKAKHLAFKEISQSLFLLVFLLSATMFKSKLAMAQGHCVPTPTPYTTPINDACELWNVLLYYEQNPIHVVIEFAPDVYINLGHIPPNAFPITIADKCTLNGDYDVFNVDNHRSIGTTIYMPWGFEWIQNCTDPTPYDLQFGEKRGAAFYMMDESMFTKIRLQGPKTDTKDWRFYFIEDMCGVWYPALESSSMGIEVEGENCRIAYCELFGFTHSAVYVHDIKENVPFGSPDGHFYFYNNYVHHNKSYGWGYGLWISGGNNAPCTYDPSMAIQTWCCPRHPVTNQCVYTGTNFFNHEAPDEIAHINDNYFMDNKHDIAATGNRNSLLILRNTFSRYSGDFNINRHGPRDACNPRNNPNTPTSWQPANIPAAVVNAFCKTPPCTPPYNFAPANSNPFRAHITETGGEETDIRDNVFYRGVNEMDMQYPNIITCSVTPFNNQPPSIFNQATVIIQNNWMRDAYSTTASGQHWKHINISGSYSGFWDLLGDNNLEIGDQLGSTIAQFQNYYQNLPVNVGQAGPFNSASATPVAIIGSSEPGNPVKTNTDKTIYAGNALEFDAIFCFDGNRNSPPINYCTYFYRFHEAGSELTDEVRAINGHIITNIFENPGTYDVTLFMIDSVTHKLSDIATQTILVKQPPQEGNYKLVFNVKDTYIGRVMYSHDWACNNVIDYYDTPAPQTTTGFLKYAEINGVEVWTEDIGMDPAGNTAGDWERWELVIPSDIVMSAADGMLTIELGLRAATPVNAFFVRGVAVWYDDVYFSCPHDEQINLVRNGGFEQRVAAAITNPEPSQAVDWEFLDEDEFDPIPGCTPPYCFTNRIDLAGLDCPPANYPDNFFNYNIQSGYLSGDERRSGLTCYKGYVRYMQDVLWEVNSTEYTFQYMTGGSTITNGLQYTQGKYKAVRQSFDYLCGDAVRNANFNFILKQNPGSNKVNVLKLINASAGQSFVTITDLKGTLFYSGVKTGAGFELDAMLPPGMYMVTITNNGSKATKKWITLK